LRSKVNIKDDQALNSLKTAILSAFSDIITIEDVDTFLQKDFVWGKTISPTEARLRYQYTLLARLKQVDRFKKMFDQPGEDLLKFMDKLFDYSESLRQSDSNAWKKDAKAIFKEYFDEIDEGLKLSSQYTSLSGEWDKTNKKYEAIVKELNNNRVASGSRGSRRIINKYLYKQLGEGRAKGLGSWLNLS
jgi:hypothetical protein